MCWSHIFIQIKKNASKKAATLKSKTSGASQNAPFGEKGKQRKRGYPKMLDIKIEQK